MTHRAQHFEDGLGPNRAHRHHAARARLPRNCTRQHLWVSRGGHAEVVGVEQEGSVGHVRRLLSGIQRHHLKNSSKSDNSVKTKGKLTNTIVQEAMIQQGKFRMLKCCLVLIKRWEKFCKNPRVFQWYLYWDYMENLW